ncbi:MAG: hypothetical protein ABI763_09135, partial [Bacteroidota bacterium]
IASNKLLCGLQTVALRTNSKAAHNSTYKKLAVQWLNEALCFVSTSVLADSLVLRNRQLLVAANRYVQFEFVIILEKMHCPTDPGSTVW